MLLAQTQRTAADASATVSRSYSPIFANAEAPSGVQRTARLNKLIRTHEQGVFSAAPAPYSSYRNRPSPEKPGSLMLFSAPWRIGIEWRIAQEYLIGLFGGRFIPFCFHPWNYSGYKQLRAPRPSRCRIRAHAAGASLARLHPRA